MSAGSLDHSSLPTIMNHGGWFMMVELCWLIRISFHPRPMIPPVFLECVLSVACWAYFLHNLTHTDLHTHALRSESIYRGSQFNGSDFVLGSVSFLTVPSLCLCTQEPRFFFSLPKEVFIGCPLKKEKKQSRPIHSGPRHAAHAMSSLPSRYYIQPQHTPYIPRDGGGPPLLFFYMHD